jgi:peptidyl-prolyl cis-trans isomerase SurA
MRKDSLYPLAFALAAGLALGAGAPSSWAQAKPAPPVPTSPRPTTPAKPTPATKAAPGAPKLVDKVLAVVDEDPILQTDVDRAIRLGFQKPEAGEKPDTFRRRVLSSLVDERIRSHEVDRFGFTEIPVEEVEAEVTRIQKTFPDDRAFQKALSEVGLTLQGLRQRVTQQLLVLTYVDERLGPRVLIGNDEISKYYRSVLTPQMQKLGQAPPPEPEVRDQIREILKQQKLNDEMKKWTDGLRAKADIVIHPEAGAEAPLPPVVKRVTAPVKPPG